MNPIECPASSIRRARYVAIRRNVRRAAWMLSMLATSAAFAQTKSDPDYRAGFDAWQQARYPSASEHLSRYRLTVAYGKSYDVDYLLGTAWCRIPGMAPRGADLLGWALQHDMPEVATTLFRSEQQACSALVTSNVVARQPTMLARTNLGAGASARAAGKLFFAVGSDSSAFSAYPLELVSPLPEAAYEARLYPLTEGEAALKATATRLGDGYRVVAEDRFVLASRAHTEAQLRAIASSLADFVRFLHDAYQIEFPDRYVTIYLLQDPQALVAFAQSVHGLRASPMNLGYAFQNDLSVVGLVRSNEIGSLLHELFHIGVRSNFGDIPSWMDESIASLYETSDVSAPGPGVYRGVDNWRGTVIERMGAGRNFQIARLVASLSSDRPTTEGASPRDFRSDESAYEAALGRYFAMYLQDRNALRATYLVFRERPAWTVGMPAQLASIRLIETATGKPSRRLESDFIDWLDSKFRRTPAPSAGNAATAPGLPGSASSMQPCRPEQQMQQRPC